MKHIGFLFVVTFCLANPIAGVEKVNNCQQSMEQCKHVLPKDSVQCNDVDKYLECIQNVTGPACDDIKVISKNIEEIMAKAKIECPDVRNNMCISKTEMNSCVKKFNRTLVDLDLTDNAELKCRLAKGLVTCLEKNGKCTLHAIQATVHYHLNRTDCAESVDLCDRTMQENCSVTYVKSEKANCDKLHDLRKCLRTEGSCPEGHIHFIVRTYMQDQSFDCSDVDACNQVKEENCMLDVFDNHTDTKEDRCRRFKAYKSCMVAAQCNDLYLDVKVAVIDKNLKNPCDGASAILASIGLTLLMAVFTNFWK